MAGGAGAGGGMMGLQQGTALSGDLVGGIGGLISSLGYRPPRLPRAEGMEQRLRQLAQSQLLGGGQQLLGATALYNQLAPVLMSQLPGLHYVPGSAGGDTGTVGDGTGSSGSPMASYQQALQNSQQQQAMQQQLTGLNRQIKGMKGASPQRHDLRMQRKTLRQQLKQLPTAAQLERQQYLGGTMGSQNPAMFDVRMGGLTGGGPGITGGVPQSGNSSLGDIRSLMDSLSSGPSLTDIYNQHMNGSVAG